MKNLTKIFMMVAAGMLAFSCVTDATEDLGVNVGGEGQTTITLSLEDPDTKVQFGTKDGDTYPLYWNEGDAISVQQDSKFCTSTSLTGVAEGAKTATFTFGDLSAFNMANYVHVLYPVHTEDLDTSERASTFTFVIPAVQQYCEGGVDPKALVLYGVKEMNADLSSIQMKSAVGVLRIAVKGNGEVLKGLTVETLKEAATNKAGGDDNGIAGAFICFTSTSNAHKTGGRIVSTRTITMALPEEGLTLGEEEQVIYVAVRGIGSGVEGEANHGEMKVTLTDADGEKMEVTFDTTNNPIKAGVVREFKPIVFEPNVGVGGEITIDSEEALVEFAKHAISYTKATVTKDLDMNNVSAEDLAYFPIENFGAYEFDGGDYTIDNLTTPLFGTTEATIKNVKLANINIEETTRLHSGALACVMDGGSLTNCEIVSGTFTYNNTTYELNANTDTTIINVGCMVGSAKNVTVNDCTNRASLTILSASGTVIDNGDPAFGGIIGRLYSTESPLNHNNLKNYGDIEYNDAAHTYKNKYRPVIGGICGISNRANISNLYTEGDVTITSSVYSPRFGCLFGYLSDTNITTAENHGDVMWCSRQSYTHMGNCIGNIIASELHTADTSGLTIEGVVNYGTLKSGVAADGKKAFSTVDCFFGGIAGTSTSNNFTKFKNCEQRGKIVLDVRLAPATVADWQNIGYQIGGIIGKCGMPSFENCDNYGEISFTGTAVASLYVGGIAGGRASGTQTFDNCDNFGNITVSPIGNSSDPVAAVKTYIGGIYGVATAATTIKNCTTSADATIEFNGTTSGVLCMGGILGVHDQNLEILDCTNNATILVDGATVNNSYYIGGIIGSSAVSSSIIVNANNLTNTGTVKITNSSYGSTSAIAGVLAHVKTGKFTCNGLYNKGKVIFNTTTSSKNTAAGGIIGYLQNPAELTASNFINYDTGNLNISGETLTGSLYIGGVCGAYHNTNTTVSYSGKLINLGNITVTKGTASTQGIGGIFGDMKAGGISDAIMYGDISAVDCANTGMLLGEKRGTFIASNCQVGGRIATTATTETIVGTPGYNDPVSGEWVEGTDDQTVVVPTWIKLDESNWFQYIYSTAVEESVAKGDGCSLLESAPTVE